MTWDTGHYEGLRNKDSSAMMAQKIEYNFQSKKCSIKCKSIYFPVLFWLSNVTPYSLIKSGRFLRKGLLILNVLFLSLA